jgi:hypothetical protein
MKNYPPILEANPIRQQASEKAWQLFLKEYNLPEVEPDFEPILYTPRELPKDLADRIVLNSTDGILDGTKAKEILQNFTVNLRAVLYGDFYDNLLNIEDIILDSFDGGVCGSFYRAFYKQASYPFSISNNYGRLSFILGKDGKLLAMRSNLIPLVDLPAQGSIEPEILIEQLIGREFSYSGFSGDEQIYKVTRCADIEDIEDKNLVVYPKLDNDKLIFHLAYMVGVGNGKWTVYFDGITGEEIDITQNFST